MYEESLNDALNMALGNEEIPPFVGVEQSEYVAGELTSWLVTTQAQSDTDIDEEGLTDLIRNAIKAAYIAGCLDTATNQPELATTVVGKSGTQVNIYIS